MGKKKDKTFSYNNTHGHGVYPPHYPVGERYPHTSYHNNDPFWIYEELGILKDWIISLTKLGGMLAQSETDDVSELTNEIKDIISKLSTLFNGLYSALNSLYNADVTYNAYLVEALKKLLNQIKDNTGSINDINIDIKNIEGDISSIENTINNIWKALEEMSSQSVSAITLNYNSDYSFNFYNGFYNDNYVNSDYVTRKDTELVTGDGTYHSLEYNLSFGGYHRLNNDYVYTSGEDDGVCPIFSHGSNVNGRNYICDLILSDGLADFNSLDSALFVPSIWNMNPVSARARFPVVNAYHCDSHNTLTITMQAIQDGFNQQFYYYIANNLASSISFGNCAMDFTFTTHTLT